MGVLPVSSLWVTPLHSSVLALRVALRVALLRSPTAAVWVTRNREYQGP